MSAKEQHTGDQQELLKRIKKGDEKAFILIYETYSVPIFTNLVRLVKSEMIARDILQDVFLKIWEKRENINEDGHFRAWIYKIAENLVFDFYRNTARDVKRRSDFIALAMLSSNDDTIQLFQEEKAKLLENAIQQLPAQRQQVFRLCKVEGKSYKQASEILGISESTISDHIVKATKAIKIYFESNRPLSLLLSFITLFSDQ